MTVVTIHDCRKLGFCMRSVRPWFANHGLDFREFVRNGIDSSEIEHIDDAMMRRAIAEAERREADGR